MQILWSILSQRGPGIRVPIKAGEGTGGHIHPDPMAGLKQAAGGHQIDLVLIHLAWLERARLLAALSESSAHDALRQDAGSTIERPSGRT